MKRSLLAVLLLGGLSANAQHGLEKIWESDTTLAVPESVLPDTKNGVLYVSLIDGAPWGADGQGGIATLDLSGKILNATWVTGLHAPKGMGIVGKKLYVADMGDVVVIDIPSRKVDNRIAVPGAENLNDITVDSKGAVYVSDSKHGTVHRITNGKVESYMAGLKGLNGLKAVGSDLYVMAGKDIFKADKDKKMTKLSEMEFGGDGIEPVGNGDFIGSSWSGYINYIGADGKTQMLLDTRELKRNTADIGYDPEKRIVYVPTFFAKSVVAYRLK